MRIAVAAHSFQAGDIKKNAETIMELLIQAQKEECDLLLTPELSLTGYGPGDQFNRPELQAAVIHYTQELAQATAEKDNKTALLLGTPNLLEDGRMMNSMAFLAEGEIKQFLNKEILPNYEVFDEARYFVSDTTAPHAFEWCDHKIGVLICADGWMEEPAMRLRHDGCEILLWPSASPFEAGKEALRLEAEALRVQQTGIPLITTNFVCGQDEIVFDGGGTARHPLFGIQAAPPRFAEGLWSVDFVDGDLKLHSDNTVSALWKNTQTVEGEILSALSLSIHDFVKKREADRVMILLEDLASYLLLFMCVEIFGPKNVVAVGLSKDAWQAKATKQLGVEYRQLEIDKVHDTLLAQVTDKPDEHDSSVSRSSVANTALQIMCGQFNALLLNNASKTQSAMGEVASYGDFAPLGDLYDGQLLNLALFYYRKQKYRKQEPVLPLKEIRGFRSQYEKEAQQETLTFLEKQHIRLEETEDPAENLMLYGHESSRGRMKDWPWRMNLTPRQLDVVIKMYIEQQIDIRTISAQTSLSEEAVASVCLHIEKMEGIRRRLPPAPKMSPRALQYDRRTPICAGFSWQSFNLSLPSYTPSWRRVGQESV